LNAKPPSGMMIPSMVESMEDEIEKLVAEVNELERKLKIATEDRSLLIKKLEEMEKCQSQAKVKK
jgi:hypothetical protein